MMNMRKIVHTERGGSSELDPYKGNTIKQNVLSIRRSAVPRSAVPNGIALTLK